MWYLCDNWEYSVNRPDYLRRHLKSNHEGVRHPSLCLMWTSCNYNRLCEATHWKQTWIFINHYLYLLLFSVYPLFYFPRSLGWCLTAGAVHHWLRWFLYTGVMSKHYYNSLYNIYPCDFCEYVATSISVLIRPRKG